MAFFIGNCEITQRFLLGTALYPSFNIMQEAIIAAQVEVITVAIRRQLSNEKNDATNTFWSYIKSLNCKLLPNTAGCFNAKEAIYTAHIAREIFETNWIKLEVIGDDQTLQPHSLELLTAAEALVKQDFIVLPYCTEDLVLCQQLVAIGCQILMPWGAPIGTGKGLLNPDALRLLRERLPHITLIIDAGLGAPSHAAAAMELGFDGVLLNSAVALSHHPVRMAAAFSQAITAGRLAFEAGLMPRREVASASTPIFGKPLVID